MTFSMRRAIDLLAKRTGTDGAIPTLLQSLRRRKCQRNEIDVAALEERLLFSANPLQAGLDVLAVDSLDSADSLLPEVVALADESGYSSVDESAVDSLNASDLSASEVVFLDASLYDVGRLFDEMTDHFGGRAKIYFLESDQNGIEQISSTLKQHVDVSAVHILSHGAEGQIQLGDTLLNPASANAHASEIFHWGDSLTSDADILIYGCDLAAYDQGQELIQDLALLTDADVAASTDVTGAIVGADWDLEFTWGAIETTSFESSVNWTGTMALAPLDQVLVNGDAADGHTISSLQETSETERGSDSAVAVAPNGDHVVVWTSEGNASVGKDVFLQRFDSSGNKLGLQQKVNDEFDAGDQHSVSVAISDSGDFVVVWASENQDGTPASIYARLYTADGTPTGITGGDAFKVSQVGGDDSLSAGEQRNPDVAMNAAGQFAIAWEGEGFGEVDGIMGRVYEADGTPIDNPFDANNALGNGGTQSSPTVGINSDASKVVIAWNDNNNPANSQSAVVSGAVFDSSGNALAQINTPDIPLFDLVLQNPSLDVRDDGYIAFAYDELVHVYNIFTSSWDFDTSAAIRVQVFHIDDSTHTFSSSTDGSEFGGHHTSPSVSIDDDGIIATWEHDGDIYARKYIVDTGFGIRADAQGGQFLVNNHTGGSQYAASVDSLGADTFAVVWSGNGTDQYSTTGDSDGVWINRYGVLTQAFDDTITTYEQVGSSFALADLIANDSDGVGSGFTLDSFTQPTQGTLTESSGVFTYTPNVGATGLDSFTYTVTDGLSNPHTATVTLTLDPVTDLGSTWLSLKEDDQFLASEIVSLGGTGFELEPPNGTTGGELSSVIDFGAYDTTAKVNAVHYVTRDILVGNTDTFQLLAGDVIASVDNDNVDLNGLTVHRDDVFVYRPSTSQFTLLMRNPVGGHIAALTLVETQTQVGGTTLEAGTFLLVARNDDHSIRAYRPDRLGATTTAESQFVLLDDSSPSAEFKDIDAVDVVEEALVLNGQVIKAGQIIISTRGDETLGSGFSARAQDVVALDVITTTQEGTPDFTVTALLDGDEIGFEDGNNNEDIVAFSFVPSSPVVANADGFSVDENSQVNSYDILANDQNATTPTVTLDTASTIGSVTLNLDNTIDYDPNGQFENLGLGDSITDTFSYTVTTIGGTDTATVTVTIVGENDNPGGGGYSANVSQNAASFSASLIGTATDADDGATFSVTTHDHVNDAGVSVLGNQVQVDPAFFSYLDEGDSTTINFNYTIADEHGATVAAVASITINGTNDAPDITSDGGGAMALINVPENTSVSTTITTVVANEIDQFDSVMYSITGGIDGSLFDIHATTGVLTFNTVPNYESASDADGLNTYEVRVTATDLLGDTDDQLITVVVTDENEAPEITTGSGLDVTVSEDDPSASFDLLGDITDPDGDSLFVSSFVHLSGDTSGVMISGNDLIVDPAAYQALRPGESVTVVYEYYVSDSALDVQATATVTITGENETPTAVDDSGIALVGQTIVIQAFANDMDDAPINPANYNLLALPVSASATNNGDGTFNFSASTSGNYSFTYNFFDSDGAASNVATVNVTVFDNAATGLWLSTAGDVVGSGVSNQDSWNSSEVLHYGDPNLFFNVGAGITNGTISSVFDLTDFGNANVTALHYVTSDVDLGTLPSAFQLQAGDVLFAVDQNVTLSSDNAESIEVGDLGVFRPTTRGDYSTGQFFEVFDSVQGGSAITSVTVAESDVLVGDVTIGQGTLLYSCAGSPGLHTFLADTVGVTTTTGTHQTLLSGGPGQSFDGVELIEVSTQLGNVTLSAGTILVSTSAAGDLGTTASASVMPEDIAVITVDTTILGSGVEANSAVRLFHGADAGFGGAAENIDALALTREQLQQHEISGTIYEDVAGDGSVAGDQAVAGVQVMLYRDNGDGLPGANDLLIQVDTTDGNGEYRFVQLRDAEYYVVVDSTTVAPTTTVNTPSGFWAEQTYGAAGSAYLNSSNVLQYTTRAGSLFGGREYGATDDATSLATAEHIVRVDLDQADVSAADFGFSFNVVTHVDDAPTNLQGSLRQFIKNANVILGNNDMRFVPADAIAATPGAFTFLRGQGPNAVGANGAEWWQLQVQSELPAITDAQTVIDGTAYSGQSGTILNTNRNLLGYQGTVGVGPDGVPNTGDEFTLNHLEGSELEIVSTGGIGTGLHVIADQVEIQRLAIRGFGFAGQNSSGNIVVGNGVASVTGTSIHDNVIGSAADDFSISAIQNPHVNISVLSADSGLIVNNLIGFSNSTGVLLTGSSQTDASDNWQIQGNEIRSSGLSNVRHDAIDAQFGSGHQVTGNLLVNSGGSGFDAYRSAGGHIVEQNSIVQNGWGGLETAGARLFGDSNVVRYNKIVGNAGPGVLVLGESAPFGTLLEGTSATGNAIRQNLFRDNQSNAIDLANGTLDPVVVGSGDGISLNDGMLDLQQGNLGIDHPALAKATLDQGVLTIRGTAVANAEVEFYLANPGAGDTFSGTQFGEGTYYLGTTVADSGGNFNFVLINPPAVVNHDAAVTAITIDDNGNTSEFGNVLEIDGVPQAVDDDFTILEDTPLVGSVAVNDADVDGDLLTYSLSLTNDVQHGILNFMSDGSFDYTPTPNFHGSDSFEYILNASGESAVATVVIHVLEVNDDPTASGPVQAVFSEDGASAIVDLLFGASDVDDSDNLSIVNLTLTGDASGIRVQGSNVAVDPSAYELSVGTSEMITLTYDIVDGRTGSVTQSSTIEIVGINDAPVGGNDAITVDEATIVTFGSLVLLGNDVDPDSTVTASLANGPAHGQVTFHNDGSFTYEHDGSETSSDTFRYVVTDSNGAQDVARVDVTIMPVNDAPTAQPDRFSTQGILLIDTAGSGVLANDSDVDSDTLTVSVVRGPNHGTLTMQQDGTFVYAPDSDFVGVDTFEYAVTDDDGSTAITQAQIEVALIPPIIESPAVEPAPEPTSSPTIETDPAPDAGPPVPIAPVVNQTESEDDEDPIPTSQDIQQHDDEIFDEADVERPVDTASETDEQRESQAIRVASVAQFTRQTINRDQSSIPTNGQPQEITLAHRVSAIRELLSNDVVINNLEAMRDDLRLTMNVPEIAGTSLVAATSAFTIGYVGWVFRAGYLLASVLSAVPSWQSIDPLPILTYMEDKRDDEDDDDSVESMMRKSEDEEA